MKGKNNVVENVIHSDNPDEDACNCERDVNLEGKIYMVKNITVILAIELICE